MVLSPDPLAFHRSHARKPPFPGWTRRTPDGLFFAPEHRFPGYPCCCGQDCDYCSFQNPVIEFVIDLGAGGWTADPEFGWCTEHCEGAAGEFTTTVFSGGDGDVCVWSQLFYLSFDCSYWAYLTLEEVGAEWRYKLDWWVYYQVGQSAEAVYLSDLTSDTDCLSLVDGDGKIPLTKQSDSPDPVCEGSLPNLIYIWPA